MIGMEPTRKDMWEREPREQTFVDVGWSRQVNLKFPNSEQIAAAGFYYTGTNDQVRCFWCALELRSWVPGDDPWREHARYSPSCPWLLRCRGCYFVRKVMQEMPTPENIAKYKRLVLQDWPELHGMLVLLSTV